MAQTIFAFSMHKSGSTLFFGILRDICNKSLLLDLPHKKKYFAVTEVLAKKGIGPAPLMNPDFLTQYEFSFNDLNTIYGGFRFVPSFFFDSIEETSNIIGLVRDPRDQLTSHYYSMSRSHVIPPGKPGKDMLKNRERLQKLTIDEFIHSQISSGIWLERSNRIIELAKKPDSKFWRYEDVIFGKQKWLDEILDRVKIDLPLQERISIMKMHDVIPIQENKNLHIRKVTPGDHKEKLNKSTIDELNLHFEEVLGYWDYK